MEKLLKYYEENPWTGRIGNCLVIACKQVYPEWDERVQIYKTLAKRIDPDYEPNENPNKDSCVAIIINYNDTPGITWEEIKQILQ